MSELKKKREDEKTVQVKFFDTSALLNGNFPEEFDYVSSTVLRELENIKNAGKKKSSSVKQMARKVARELLTRSPKIFTLRET
jgi:rRNA maturation endonuclease Nob1